MVTREEFLKKEESRVKEILKRDLTSEQKQATESELRSIQYSLGKTREAETTEFRRKRASGQALTEREREYEKSAQHLDVELKKVEEKGFDVKATDKKALYGHLAKYPADSKVITKQTKKGLEIEVRSRAIEEVERQPKDVLQDDLQQPREYELKGERYEKARRLLKPWYEAQEKFLAPLQTTPEEHPVVQYGKGFARTLLGIGSGIATTSATVGVMIGHAIEKPFEVGRALVTGVKQVPTKAREAVKETKAKIKEKPGEFLGEASAYAVLFLAPAVEKRIRWSRAKAKTEFIEVVTKPTGKIKESVGVAKTKFMGKDYPSLFKSRFKTAPVAEGITKGKGVTKIITETAKGKVKTVAGTKFVTGDLGKIFEQLSTSKYISQAGAKGWEAGRYMIQKTKPDLLTTIGETLTGKGPAGTVKGITQIRTPPTTTPGITFYPPTKVTTGSAISKIIGETVKQTAKPVATIKPSIASAITGITPTKKVTKQEEAYFSRVGTIQPKYELEPKVIRRKGRLTEQQARALTFQAIDQAQKEMMRGTQRALQQPSLQQSLLQTPMRVSKPATKQVEAQKMVSLQRALQFQALEQKALQRVIGKPIGRVFPPKPVGRVLTLPPAVAGPSGIMGRRGRLPVWWRYWERHWPVATTPGEIAKAFGWHPQRKRRRR